MKESKKEMDEASEKKTKRPHVKGDNSQAPSWIIDRTSDYFLHHPKSYIHVSCSRKSGTWVNTPLK